MGATSAGFLLLTDNTAAVDGTYCFSGTGKRYPKDFPFDFPATATLFGESVTFCANRSAGGRLCKVVLPEPPFAFFRVRVFRVHKVFHRPVKVQLATVNLNTPESTLFPVKVFRLFAFQGFKGGVSHGCQVFFGLLSHIGNLPQFTHRSIIAGKTGKSKELSFPSHWKCPKKQSPNQIPMKTLRKAQGSSKSCFPEIRKFGM